MNVSGNEEEERRAYDIVDTEDELNESRATMRYGEEEEETASRAGRDHSTVLSGLEDNEMESEVAASPRERLSRKRVRSHIEDSFDYMMGTPRNRTTPRSARAKRRREAKDRAQSDRARRRHHTTYPMRIVTAEAKLARVRHIFLTLQRKRANESQIMNELMVLLDLPFGRRDRATEMVRTLRGMIDSGDSDDDVSEVSDNDDFSAAEESDRSITVDNEDSDHDMAAVEESDRSNDATTVEHEDSDDDIIIIEPPVGSTAERVLGRLEAEDVNMKLNKTILMAGMRISAIRRQWEAKYEIGRAHV